MIKTTKEKIQVEFLGIQKRVDGSSFVMVNEVESHTTVAYDERLHVLVNGED